MASSNHSEHLIANYLASWYIALFLNNRFSRPQPRKDSAMSTSVYPILDIAWGGGALISLAFICFAVWFNLLSDVTVCWNWRNSMRANRRIGDMTIVSTVIITTWANSHIDFMPWWVANLISIVIGYFLARALYVDPREWRYQKAFATRPIPPGSY